MAFKNGRFKPADAAPNDGFAGPEHDGGGAGKKELAGVQGAKHEKVACEAVQADFDAF